MRNRSYHIARRRSKLQGEQLDITFPRRGRPSRFRRLERAGQMRLNLAGGLNQTRSVVTSPPEPETLDDALQMTFPVRPYTEDELRAEFERLFPAEG